MDVERFNEAQSVKWCHLPKAFTGDLAEELCKRDGVYSRELKAGERFEYHAIGKARLIVIEEGRKHG